jgi:Nucleotidyl transferase AbiEii toxin, Type IV TA system
MEDEPERSRLARAAAEAALVRVVHHYGARPEFVVLGGLVPELLCSQSNYKHAGTTDVDVQVDLEIACGSVNGVRLEQALRDAEFQPTGKVWRWTSRGIDRAVVKFELLADQTDVATNVELTFDGCTALGAANLRGTGFAARDVVVQTLRSKIGDDLRTVEVNVTGLAGFLLAKAEAARSRRRPKDWYDIAFVLQHNDAGGPQDAADAVLARFRADLVGAVRTSFDELAANFHEPSNQGPEAYATQMQIDHPEIDEATLRADAVLAVQEFYSRLFSQ